MNKSQIRHSRVLPAFAGVLLIFTGLMMSGCGGHGGETEPPIEEDSVRPHAISIQEATLLCKRFRTVTDTLNEKCPTYKEQMNLGYAEAFNRDTYRILLKQRDSAGQLCAGVRIYYGLSEKGVMKLIMVPYDKNGNDILNHLISTETEGKGDSSATTTRSLKAGGGGGAQAMEQGSLCPTLCSPTGPLTPPPTP